MDDNVELSVALNILNKKIANLNMMIIENSTPELENELKKYLDIKKEIYKGNTLLVKKVIDSVDEKNG